MSKTYNELLEENQNLHTELYLKTLVPVSDASKNTVKKKAGKKEPEVTVTPEPEPEVTVTPETETEE